jgi:hypothetical protein
MAIALKNWDSEFFFYFYVYLKVKKARRDSNLLVAVPPT